MIKQLFLILSLFGISFTFCQTKEISDSQLKNILKEAQQVLDSASYSRTLQWVDLVKDRAPAKRWDTILIRIYNKMSWTYMQKNHNDKSIAKCRIILKNCPEHIRKSTPYSETLEYIGRSYGNMAQYPKAIEYINHSLALKKQLLRKNHPQIARLHLAKGMIFNGISQQLKAEKSFSLALDIYNQNEGNLNDKQVLYKNMANNYGRLGKHELAKKYNKLQLALAIKLYGPNSQRVADSYLSLGIVHFSKAESLTALKYYKKAEQIYTQLGLNNSGEISNIYYELGKVYTKLNQIARAIEYYQNILTINQNLIGKNHYGMGLVYYNLGDAYRCMGNQKKALENLQKSKAIFLHAKNISDVYICHVETVITQCLNPIENKDRILEILEKNKKVYTKNRLYENVAFCNIRIAELFTKNKEFQKAIDYLTLNLNINQINIEDIPYIETLCNISTNYSNLNKFKEAQFYNKKIANILEYNDKSNSLNFDNIKRATLIPGYLRSKMYHHQKFFEYTNDSNYLDSIHHNNLNILEIREYLDNFKSNSLDKANNTISYLEAFDYCLGFYVQDYSNKLDTAFKIVEKTKSRELTINFNAVNATKVGNVPDSLLQQEKLINIELSKVRKLKFESKSDSLNSLYKLQLFDLNQRKNKLYELFKKEFPRYHNLKYNNEVIDIALIQKKLNTDQLLIEYFLGTDDLFIFTITKNHYDVKQIKIPENFQLSISQLRNSIYKYDDEEQAKTYLKSAHQLYNTLIKPIKKELKQKLIIIPDGVLNYIPFETLLEEKVDQITSYKNLPYLIKNHQISYNYSATLYHQLLTQESEAAKENLVAFAPSFKDNKENFKSISARRNGFENLLYNIPEAEMAHDYISGRLFKGNAATEENFLKNASNYKIIHLSTHAKSNDKLGDYSYIVMSKVNDSIDDPNRIYTSELYNLNLNADMVVLSACETGLGELQKGEGIISLARAFTYAGAKSTINSLWSVNDASTKTLMEEFYKNIKAGKTKDQALHEAKLSYLENEDMDAPYFWASFIAMGNMEPIVLSSGFNYWWLLLLPVVFGLIYFVKRRN